MSGYIVQHNGVTQFTADGLNVINTSTYNFTDSTPPPPPDGRLTNALVTWMTHTPFTQATDLTLYKNCAGVIAPRQVPIDWPYVSGATYKWMNPAGKYVAFQINTPGPNEPMTNHSIKNPNYAGGLPWDVSLSTSPGDFTGPTVLRWPNGDPIYKENVLVSDTPALWFRNGLGTNFYAGLAPSSAYYMNFRVHGGGAGIIAVASQ